jgi:hypothetical protein
MGQDKINVKAMIQHSNLYDVNVRQNPVCSLSRRINRVTEFDV